MRLILEQTKPALSINKFLKAIIEVLAADLIGSAMKNWVSFMHIITPRQILFFKSDSFVTWTSQLISVLYGIKYNIRNMRYSYVLEIIGRSFPTVYSACLYDIDDTFTN